MKQLTFVKPGQPLEWQEVPDPQLQGPGEALVRPVAVASCDLDKAVVQGATPWNGPFAFGHEFVAEVVAVGAEVQNFRPGQMVVVPFQISCGKCERCRRGLTGSCQSVKAGAMYGLAPLGGEWGGALSDLVRVPFAEAMLVPVPAGLAPATIASASDNLPDGWRTVGPYLEKLPGAPVLIVGGALTGSIGLYATAIALALGASKVDYVDIDLARLEVAQKLGANPLEVKGAYPRKFGAYPITVDSSANPEGLASALRSTEPGGNCTSTGIYFKPVALPLLEMYTIGMNFTTSQLSARTVIPKILELVQAGRLHPELITSDTASWNEAGEALLSYRTKLVITLD
jgi:alcohol dehydrogenase